MWQEGGIQKLVSGIYKKDIIIDSMDTENMTTLHYEWFYTLIFKNVDKIYKLLRW